MRSGHFVEGFIQSGLETYKDTDCTASLANLFQCLILDCHHGEEVFPISIWYLSLQLRPSVSRPTTMHRCEEPGLVFLITSVDIGRLQLAPPARAFCSSG